MIIVTGGAGFVGSNIVFALNQRGLDRVFVVDNLSDGRKFRNLTGARIADYCDKDDFIERVRRGEDFGPVRAVIHQGACSTTTEWDGRYMMRNNYEYSKQLLHYCIDRRIPYIYASSASVYGAGPVFREDPSHESPLNVYGYSKYLFDHYVRRLLPGAPMPIVGLRYFNVYGPREAHKASMASVAFHMREQLLRDATLRLFEGCDGYADGEQRRDFIHVDDVAAVNLWFVDHPDKRGIFNLGTGRAQTFNEVARAVLQHYGRGRVDYIPFPEHLRGRYQSYTQADLSALRAAGYTETFLSVQQGVTAYMEWLDSR